MGICLGTTRNGYTLGMELFDRILVKEEAQNTDAQKIRRWIHRKNRATNELLGLKKGYVVNEITEQVGKTKVILQNGKNYAHHWNLNWFYVEKEEELEEILEKGEPNEDTSHFFCRRIVILEDEALAKKVRNVLKKKVFFVSKEEFNKLWWEIHKEWNLC